jgi:hypothetical protein
MIILHPNGKFALLTKSNRWYKVQANQKRHLPRGDRNS